MNNYQNNQQFYPELPKPVVYQPYVVQPMQQPQQQPIQYAQPAMAQPQPMQVAQPVMTAPQPQPLPTV